MSEETCTVTPEQEALAGKYMTFTLGGEEYAIAIGKIREILGVPPITRVPCSANHVRGVINLRGRIIPVVCLREKFHMPPVELDEKSCVVIIDLDGETENQMGVLVDRVSEVANIAPENIEIEHGSGGGVRDHVLALAKLEGGIKILLRIESVLHGKDSSSATGVVETSCAASI